MGLIRIQHKLTTHARSLARQRPFRVGVADLFQSEQHQPKEIDKEPVGPDDELISTKTPSGRKEFCGARCEHCNERTGHHDNNYCPLGNSGMTPYSITTNNSVDMMKTDLTNKLGRDRRLLRTKASVARIDHANN